MDLGMTVLPRLGGGHLYNLAGTTLEDNVAVLAEGGALGGVGVRGTGITTPKIFIRHPTSFSVLPW